LLVNIRPAPYSPLHCIRAWRSSSGGLVMLTTISVLSFGFSAIEFFGYGPAAARYLDWLRLQSMQIAMRDGEINPKFTDFFVKVLSLALLVLLGAGAVICVVLIPLLLIIGKEATSQFMVGSSTAHVVAIVFMGSMGFLVGAAVLYVLWVGAIELLSKGLAAANRSRKGMVATISFAIGALSFTLDQIFR
jgi:hypothetical protein